MGDHFLLLLFLVVPPLLGQVVIAFLFFLRMRKTKQRPGWRQNLLGAGASILVMVLLAFAGGECYYRFCYDTTDAMGCTKLAQRWTERYFIENDAGFRDDLRYRASSTPGLRRLSFIGDSFTAGYGIKDIHHRFANLIREAHPDWEVHVLAKPGSDTSAELERVQSLHEVNYRFDVVVLVYCINDVADLYPEWNATISRIYEDPRNRNWLLRHSYFLDLIYNRLRLAREPYAKDYFSFVGEGYRDEVWDQQQARLRQFRELVEKYHGRLLVVTFPFMHRPEPVADFQHAHEALGRFWKTQGVPHLDLADSFTNVSPKSLVVNSSDPHPNELAHQIAARVILPFIEANLTNASPK